MTKVVTITDIQRFNINLPLRNKTMVLSMGIYQHSRDPKIFHFKIVIVKP